MITVTTKIKDEALYPFLFEFTEYWSKVKRLLFVDVFIRKKSPIELKSLYCSRYDLTARHYNSMIYALKGEVSNYEENLKENLKNKISKGKSLEKKIKKEQKKIEIAQRNSERILTYKLKINEWKAKRKGKKPQLPEKIKDLTISEINKEISSKRFIIHQKKRVLVRIEQEIVKIEKDLNSPAKICFGGKKLFKKQHHLKKNNYKSHQEWNEDWYLKRNSSAFFLGSSDESFGNLNAQYHREKRELKLRWFNTTEKGEHLFLDQIEFPYGQDLLDKAIEKKRSITYRLYYKKNSFYVAASFEEEKTPIITNKDNGAFGIDLNADHLAVVETDRFGNPINNYSYYFDFDKKSSEQIKAILSDYLSDIVFKALVAEKPIVIEKLDFSKKKSQLKEEGGKKYRKMLSSFAYQKFAELLQSKAAKDGIEIKFINPAFSSIIGFEKFKGYTHLTTHEKAALVLARRGLRFSERPKQKVTLPEPVRIHDSVEVRGRHVWSYWSSQKKNIRSRIISTAKSKGDSQYPLFPTGIQCDLRKTEDYSKMNYGDLMKRFQFLGCRVARGIYCSSPDYSRSI